MVIRYFIMKTVKSGDMGAKLLTGQDLSRAVDGEILAAESLGPLEAELVHEGLAALSRPLAQGATRRDGLLEHRAHRRVHGAEEKLKVHRALDFDERVELVHFQSGVLLVGVTQKPNDTTVPAQISACLADISAWMKEHHLQLNPAKTELLVFPANPVVEHNITVQLGATTVTPSKSVRNLRVTIDNRLNFTDHISKTARSCRFTLYNIRKIRPFLSEHATKLLFQSLVITRLDYCNALTAGLPACAIRPLQMIQNAAARLVFNEPKRARYTTPCLSPLAAG
ncbi:uncharacterized protein LOC127447359 [Myxocyprinus asiaticus]|uniref:uncharacterized protein LOC127447359 n=1 Tax=Myxocyprinus asiaticus TaxID=70543 RepID=UPI00222206B0|nr:uncharacterized protein LOC127447359 [Myxocyprinus asiaticus]